MEKRIAFTHITTVYLVSSLVFSFGMVKLCYSAHAPAKKHHRGNRIAHVLQATPASHSLLAAATHNHVAHLNALMRKPGFQEEILYAMPLLKATQLGHAAIAFAILNKFPIHMVHDLEYKRAYYDARTTAVKNNNLALTQLFLNDTDIDRRSQHGYTILSHAISNPKPSEELVGAILQKTHDFTYGSPDNPDKCVFFRATDLHIKQMVYAAMREHYAQTALQNTLVSAHAREHQREQKAARQNHALVSLEEYARTLAYNKAVLSARKREQEENKRVSRRNHALALLDKQARDLAYNRAALSALKREERENLKEDSDTYPASYLGLLRRATPISMEYAQDTELYTSNASEDDIHAKRRASDTSDVAEQEKDSDTLPAPYPHTLPLIASALLEEDFVAISESPESSDTLEEADGWLLG